MTNRPDHSEDLRRIDRALALAAERLREFAAQALDVERKEGGDPVTEADRTVDLLLRELLERPGEGWLSEESADDPERLSRDRVWIVDPLDGTKEFVTGIPEWSVSIGLVEDGVAVAGGIANPITGETVLGASGEGVTLNGRPATVQETDRLAGARVLASRSEVRRGEWDHYGDLGIEVVPTGSVAYKLARVAAGLATATWTLTPKNEWDVAAGCALVAAGGGAAYTPDGSPPRFNRPKTLLPGLIAAGRPLADRLPAELSRR